MKRLDRYRLELLNARAESLMSRRPGNGCLSAGSRGRLFRRPVPEFLSQFAEPNGAAPYALVQEVL
jgi:hypothetical protein